MSELPPIRQAKEGVELRPLVAVGAAGVVVAALAVLVVYLVLEARGEIGAGGPGPVPTGRAGVVLQNLIEPTGRTDPLREPAELERYGWVDRDAGVASIPIRRAMEIVAERGR